MTIDHSARRIQASNSFTADEVRAVCSVLAKAQTAGDVQQALRSQPMRNVFAKFVRMRDKLDEYGVGI